MNVNDSLNFADICTAILKISPKILKGCRLMKRNIFVLIVDFALFLSCLSDFIRHAKINIISSFKLNYRE